MSLQSNTGNGKAAQYILNGSVHEQTVIPLALNIYITVGCSARLVSSQFYRMREYVWMKDTLNWQQLKRIYSGRRQSAAAVQ